MRVGNGKNGIKVELREWDSGEWKERVRRGIEGMGEWGMEKNGIEL